MLVPGSTLFIGHSTIAMHPVPMSIAHCSLAHCQLHMCKDGRIQVGPDMPGDARHAPAKAGASPSRASIRAPQGTDAGEPPGVAVALAAPAARPSAR